MPLFLPSLPSQCLGRIEAIRLTQAVFPIPGHIDNKKASISAGLFEVVAMYWIKNWWRARELNPRPLRCERSALPTELAPHT